MGLSLLYLGSCRKLSPRDTPSTSLGQLQPSRNVRKQSLRWQPWWVPLPCGNQGTRAMATVAGWRAHGASEPGAGGKASSVGPSEIIAPRGPKWGPLGGTLKPCLCSVSSRARDGGETTGAVGSHWTIDPPLTLCDLEAPPSPRCPLGQRSG